MRFLWIAAALLCSMPANAQFLGGVADGMERAERSEMERQALEIDRRYGTNTYERQHRRNLDIERQQQLRENAEILRRLDQERFERQYGPNPRY